MTTTYASDEDHREHDVLPIKNAHRVPFPELGMDIIDRKCCLSTCRSSNSIAYVLLKSLFLWSFAFRNLIHKDNNDICVCNISADGVEAI